MLLATRIGAIAAARPIEAPELPTDLPFLGQYYGGFFGGHNAAHTALDINTGQGTSFFFYADRTGVVTRLFQHFRTEIPGYAAGNGGVLTIQIRPANANTRLPIPGSAAICSVSGFIPPTPSETEGSHGNVIVNFTTTGQLTKGQPYCIVYRNTHASPGANHVSCNISAHFVFNDDTNPANYEEPVGTNPASVGSSPVAVSGWNPVVIEGTTWFPWPCMARNNVLRYRRLGGIAAALGWEDGVWSGWGGWGGNGSSTVYRPPISGSNQVRVRFRVTRATRVVRGVFVRAFRTSTASGNLVVTLESGGSDTASGTLIEQVNVNSTVLYNVGSQDAYNEVQQTPPMDFVHWMWVPFTQNRTLTQGQFYNLRLSATGSATMAIRGSGRVDSLPELSPDGRELTWDQWDGGSSGLAAAQREIEWNAWEDCKDGCHISTNGGSSWSVTTARLMPILFKCVAT
jgi:hypothetical protein